MFYYTLGYGGYDGSGSIHLAHSTCFTEDEWKDIVRDATVKAAKIQHDKNIAQHIEYRNLPNGLKSRTPEELKASWAECKEKWENDLYGWLDAVIEEEYPYDRLAWDDIFGEVADCMVSDHGFEKLQYMHQTYFWEGDDLSREHEDPESVSPSSRRSEFFYELNKLVREQAVSNDYDRSRDWDLIRQKMIEMGYEQEEYDKAYNYHYHERRKPWLNTEEENSSLDSLVEALENSMAEDEKKYRASPEFESMVKTMRQHYLGTMVQHFKGGKYKILLEVEGTTGEYEGKTLVVYQSQDRHHKIYARPKDTFFEQVNRDDYSGPRFVPIT